jgi:methylated-DNA-[protein]-cysteine S-methyltransferase
VTSMANSTHTVIEYAVFETDWGWMGAARSVRGLTALILPQASQDNVLTQLSDTVSRGRENESSFGDLIRQVRAYFAGKRVSFNDAADLSAGTPFQRSVWLKAREIPLGESRSYSWIASAVGNPAACRAVGQALGQNPLPIIVPCHRVLTAYGGLGGFSGGLDIKKRLLALEGISTT